MRILATQALSLCFLCFYLHIEIIVHDACFFSVVSFCVVVAPNMAVPIDAGNVEQFLPAVVVLLKNVADSLVDTDDVLVGSDNDSPLARRVTRVHKAVVDMHTIVSSVLHDFRLAHARTILDDKLGFWILPRSTAWFS
jgi:hypothetical protein